MRFEDKMTIVMNHFYPPCDDAKKFYDKCPYFFHINGGSAMRSSTDTWVKKNMHFDDTGNSISSKNAKLNEMTSLYWFGANVNSDKEYIGHVHYRRHFLEQDMQQLIDGEYDILCGFPFPMRFKFSINGRDRIQAGTVEAGYRLCHVYDDFLKLDKMMRDMQLCFWEEWKTQLDMFAPCQCWIMRRELFKAWCEFMFTMLDKLEQQIDLRGRDNYQKRALAFLAERITSWWIFRYVRVNPDKVLTGAISFHEEWKPADAKDNRGDFS